MKFHEKLYALRKRAGMTQNDLAEKLNVSRQAVSRWEMGTAMPDVENLIAMSDLFSVSLDSMLKEQEATDGEEKANEEQAEQPQKGSWLLLPIVAPFFALSLLIYGWLFEKDVLCNIGVWLLGISVAAVLLLLLSIAIIRFAEKRKKK